MRRAPDPWELAAQGRYKELEGWLAANCPSHFQIDTQNPSTGETLLSTAVASAPVPIRKGTDAMRFAHIIKLLCEKYNADGGAPSATGRTPLHISAMRNSVDMTRYLAVTRNAPLREDAGGLDPFQLAMQHNAAAAAKVLEEELFRRAVAESNLSATQAHVVAGGTIEPPVESPQALRPSPPAGHPPTSGRVQAFQEYMVPTSSDSDDSSSVVPASKSTNSPGWDEEASTKPGGGVSSNSASPRLPGKARAATSFGPAALKKLHTSLDSGLSQAPRVVQEEVREFQSVYGTAFDTVCMYEATCDGGVYVLRLRGLLGYTVQDNTYFAPVMLLGFYPAASAESPTPGSAFPATPPWAIASGTSFQGTSSSGGPPPASPPFPRFRAMIDMEKLGRFHLNARATVYLDALSGAVLPSPSDHLFNRFTDFTRYAVVRSFEAIPPMVSGTSPAALPQHFPFGPPPRSLRPPPALCPPRQRSSAHPGAAGSAGVDGRLDGLTAGRPAAPRDGGPHERPLVPPERAREGRELFPPPPPPPPPPALLLPFTAARHPTALTGTVEPQQYFESVLRANHAVRHFQVMRDLSAFGDGLLQLLPDSRTIIGFLPVLASHPKTVLVTEIGITDLIRSALGPACCPTTLTSSVPQNGRRAGMSTPPETGSQLGSPASSNVYHLDAADMERLWNVRLRVEFAAAEAAPGCPFDHPPRVFFPDAARSPNADTRLTQRCFQQALRDPVTGELDPVYATTTLPPAAPSGGVDSASGTPDPPHSPSSSLQHHRSYAVLCQGSGPAVVQSPSAASPSVALPGGTAEPSAAVSVLSPDVWGTQPRPLLALLLSLKDLATQLLARVATQLGDERLMHDHRGGAVGVGGRSSSSPPKSIPTLDTLFSASPAVGQELPLGVASAGRPAAGGTSSKEKCILCLAATKDVVFLPCNHLASCRRCVARRAAHELAAGKNLSMIAPHWTCCVCAAPVQGLAEVFV
eukprot:gene6252-4501_t